MLRRWYVVVPGVMGGIGGLVDVLAAAAAKPKATPFSIPLWFWLPLLVVGFLAAITWAFHDVRVERDAMKTKMERRFEAQRYALELSSVASHAQLGRDGATGDVQISFTLTNNSGDYLRYQFEESTTSIEGKESAEDDPAWVNGGILAPNGSAQCLCPPIHGVPVVWQAGSLKVTVLYGHPSAALKYRKRQERRLSLRRPIGLPPGQGQVWAELVNDPDVEDVVAPTTAATTQDLPAT